MEVRKIAAWIPLIDEDIVDYGIGTPEQQAEAAARIDVRRAEMRAMWNALPWRVKMIRRIRPRVYEVRHRLAHARSALRGIECERDC